MNYEMKTINKTLLVSWLSIIGILFFTYFIQMIKHERSLQYLVVFTLVMLIPWLIVFLIYRKRNDWDELGYLIVIGYSFMYMFVLYTGSTQLVSNYILPLLCFLILYHKPLLILVTFGISIVANLAAFVYQFHQGIITSANIKETEIRFATIIICFVGGYISSRLYDKVHKERISSALATLKAEAANDAKGEFLAHMSHEIRTPINAVLGMDTMILRETREPKIKEYAMDIQKAGRALLSIINDILDITKIESGKMEIVEVDYDFSSLIHDTVNMINERATNKGLSFKVEVDSSIPCVLHGDDVRIRQVLINLLGNAVKYTEKGEVVFSIKGTKIDNVEKLHFSVKDTGIGIKEESIPKLFAKFERVEELRNRHIEGTGLGMAITINLLKMMGSSLDVQSEYGFGSEFSFDLEQEIIQADEVGNIAARIAQMAEEYAYEVTFTAEKAKVLVVDDNITNLSVFCNLLKETKIHIDTATSGKETLDIIKNTKYDIIFLDHMMPDMDGIEVMQYIDSNKDHLNVGTPVIALTANAIAGAKEKYLSAGFDGYLSKPIIPERLEKMIEEHLPDEKITYEKVDKEKAELKIEYQESLPSVEGVDWDYARLHLGNSDAILSTVQTVYNAISLDAQELSDYYDRIVANNQDVDAIGSYRIKVHSMKSTCILLGLLPVAGMAATLEYAARDGKVDKILQMTPYFLADFRAYKDKLSDLVQKESDEDKIEISDKNEVIHLVNQLIEKSACFDVHGADYALEQIKQYKYNDDIEKLVDTLAGAVSNLDADMVESLGNELIQLIS